MLTSETLKQIVAEARPIIERQLDDADLIAGLREVVTAEGGDWSALKALIKAQIQDERDEAGDGKRVRKILDKADYSTAYADMLGLAKMNENNFIGAESAMRRGGEAVSRLAHNHEIAGANPAPATNSAMAETHGEGVSEPRAEEDSQSNSVGVVHAVGTEQVTRSAEESVTSQEAIAAALLALHSETPVGDGNIAEPDSGLAACMEGEVATAETVGPSGPAALGSAVLDLRPGCLKPDLCASYGKKHCHPCRKAAWLEGKEIP